MENRSQVPIEIIARAMGWSVDAIAADPRQIDLIDHRAREYLEWHRSTLEPALLLKAATAHEMERLRIGEVLLSMKAASGSDLVLQSLGSASPKVVWAALSTLRQLPVWKSEGLLVPLEQPAAAAALLPFLSSAQSRVREAAMDALTRFSDPGHVERMADLLAHDDRQIRTSAASELALWHNDARAWPGLKEAFLTTDPRWRQRVVDCVGALGKTGDRQVCNEASDTLRPELVALFDRTDSDAANEASELLRALQALEPSWQTEIEEAVLNSRMMTWVKAGAAKQLAQRADGPTAEKYLLAWLDDPEFATAALKVIAGLGVKANKPAIVAKLCSDLGTAASNEQFKNLLGALMKLGAHDVVDLTQYASRLEGWDLFELTIFTKRLSAEAMLELFDRAELTLNVDQESRTAFLENWRKTDASRFGNLVHKGGRMYGFDCEDAEYGSLFGELAALAADELIFSAMEVVKEAELVCMELIVDENVRSFARTKSVDWIDPHPVLIALNTLLELKNSPRRYFALHSDGQFATVVLARTDGMNALVSQLEFPLDKSGGAQPWGQASEADHANEPST